MATEGFSWVKSWIWRVRMVQLRSTTSSGNCEPKCKWEQVANTSMMCGWMEKSSLATDVGHGKLIAMTILPGVRLTPGNVRVRTNVGAYDGCTCAKNGSS